MGERFVQARTVIANVVVAQMLPGCSIKGGSAIKLRFGGASTRFTTDLDIARIADLDTFRADLEASLRVGWGGFTGTLVVKEPATPRGVPSPYVMHPFDVKLAYRGSAWCTVPLEVGHNEIGDAENPDMGFPAKWARCSQSFAYRSLHRYRLCGLTIRWPRSFMRLRHPTPSVFMT